VFNVSGDSPLARSPAVGRLRGYLGSLLSGGFPPSVSLAVVQPHGVVLEAFGGALDLEDPVARWLPGYPQPRTALRHLLTHTSGLVDHVPFYATVAGRAPIEAALYAEASTSVPGGTVRYSDLNFMLLG
jgi:hypothetical protein